MKGLPAKKAGVKINDKIVGVDGKTVYYWNQFSAAVKKSEGKLMRLTLERAGKSQQVTVTPIEKDGKYVIGVEPLMRPTADCCCSWLSRRSARSRSARR